MQKLKRLLVFIWLLICSISAGAQKCEWLDVGGTTLSNEVAVSIATDLNDDVVVVGHFYDSFSMGSHFVPKSTNSQGSTFIIKYDEQGVIKWTKTIQHSYSGLGTSSCLPSVVVTDANNNIYVAGYFTGDIDFGNGKTLSNTINNNFAYFLVKYNANGVSQWAVKSGGTAYPSKIVIDNPGNVFLLFWFANTVGFQGTTKTLFTNSGANTDIGIVKYTSSGNFINAERFGSANQDNATGLGIDASNNIYIQAASFGTFNFGGQQLADTGEVILKLDSALKPIKGKKTNLKAGRNFAPSGLAMQANGKFAVVSNFFDSVNFGNNVWLKSPWTNYGLISTLPSVGVVYYDSSLTPIWARTNDSVSSTQPTIYAMGGVSIKNENIYFGGYLYGASTRLGASTLNFVGGQQKFFISKMDTLGNFLWSFVNEDTISKSFLYACEPDNAGNVYLTGDYYAKVTIFDKSKNGISTGADFDFFTAKISDYAITRGTVSSGPYCAGDTLKVPYTIKGIYNAGNEFIAELSDSAGNFDGGQRELGRLQDTLGGIINGQLPLFNVATNNKYRIRIISTNPVVQSYYKRDTLRLLIYSKDTANAGPNQTVCKGEPVHLGTTGGSKWVWSPTNYFVNPADSTNRQPLIKLYDSAEFRIIISDSSGCGDVDTDYVKIYVRPQLKTTILGDSIICRGYSQTLQANITGGDSTQYWYIWKRVGVSQVQGKDSFLFISPYATTQYILITGDSCGSKIDTSYFIVRMENNLKASPSADTTICKGKTATLSVTGTGCNPNYYTYDWYEVGSPNTIISTNDSIVVTPNTTTQYSVILKDTTTLLSDTATITVAVDSIFNISTIKDSTICLGQSIGLIANVFSCDTSNMVYTWTANNQQLSTNNTLTVNPTSTTTYTVIGENTFNGLKDTAQVTITVRPKLQLTVNADSTICIGQTAELRATATGGHPSTRKILWTANNQQLSTSNIVQVTPVTTTTYKALLSDGCSLQNDSVEITITVRPKLETTVNADSTICIGQTAQLRATPTGGYTPQHQLQWTANNQPLSTSNTVQVSPTQTTTYKVLLSDACTTPSDSATQTITVRPPLKVIVNPDTTICRGETVALNAITMGGNAATYSLQWMANNQQLSTNNQLQVTPTTTTTYKAILKDNCTTVNDSSTITITVRPPLSIKGIAKDSICANQILLLTATPQGGNTATYQILWFVDNGLWTSTQNPATDTPKVDTKYIVQLSDNCSPDVFDTLEVIVLPIPNADFIFNPTQGCPPLNVTVQDNSTGSDTTLNSWTIGNAEYQGTSKVEHQFTQTGTYSLKLAVANTLGCVNQKVQPNAITVFPKPKANFIVKPDIKEIEEPLTLINQSSTNTVVWDMGDGNQLTPNPKGNGDTTYSYQDTGWLNLSLIAQNNLGCFDTSTQRILLYDKVNCVVPNAFTPNGNDNINPVFAPVCVGVANYTLTIYNRWGQIIYLQENGSWNGTYNDTPVPSDVYMYKLQIQADSKKKKLTYGTVQVIR